LLTVLMATHNGAQTLPRVFDAYARLTPPAGGWALVVVDNASTDDTPGILAAHRDRLPLIARHTAKRGKNVALNEGLADCAGDLVVLTDDDAIPDEDWLVALQAAASENPAYDTFGGRIDPVWPEGGCPEWVPRLVNMGATFAISPASMCEGPTPAARIWGPNMAIRHRVFEQGHRFDESVGPSAGQYMMGSEVEFTCRIERHGHRAWFAPGARVGHIVRARQLEPRWIIERGYRLGRHMFHQEREEIGPEIARWRGAPRWMWRRFIEFRLRAAWARVRGSFDDQFSADWEVSYLRGYLDEATRSVDRKDP
jgi:glycosyltransferase involved in cell wall biosynthesis